MYAKGSSSSQTAQNTSHDVPNAFAERNLTSGATDTHLFETQGACGSRVHAKLTSLLC